MTFIQPLLKVEIVPVIVNRQSDKDPGLSTINEPMPLLKLETNAPLPDEQRKHLLTGLSRIVSQAVGKPEQYVMVSLAPVAMVMSAKDDKAAFVDVRGIGGLTSEVNRRISRSVCELLQTSLGVSPERVYLTFTDVAASHWGWNAGTFAGG